MSTSPLTIGVLTSARTLASIDPERILWVSPIAGDSECAVLYVGDVGDGGARRGLYGRAITGTVACAASTLRALLDDLRANARGGGGVRGTQ